MSFEEIRETKVSPATGEAFVAFCETISALRGPDGCPWDKEQTSVSIAGSMIEEAHEAVDAIESGDPRHLQEELGDVLLQVVFQADIAADAGLFTIDDVIADVQAKMLRRHPHVFGAQTALIAAGFTPEEIDEVATSGEVIDLWERIKAHERAAKEVLRREWMQAAGEDPDAPPGLLHDVPRSLPALRQAQKISKRAAGVGFDWDTVDGVWDKVEEERGEFLDAEPGSEHATEEFGDILFSLVNVARKEHIDAEEALRKVCTKFRNRWAIMEQSAYERSGRHIDEFSSEEREALWEQAKIQLGKEQQ